MDDKVAEEIRDLEASLSDDSGSPLHRIRDKELEISGRVLAAKRQADEIVEKARKDAAEIVRSAETGSGDAASAREKEIREEASAEAARIKEESEREAAELRARIESQTDAAVDVVLEAVTTV